MAAFARTQTNPVQRFATMLPPNPKSVKMVQEEITLSSQGGATNYIPASAFNMKKIIASSMAQKSDNAIAYPTAPSYAGDKLFFYNPEQATDASRGDPADVSGTFRLTVWGN